MSHHGRDDSKGKLMVPYSKNFHRPLVYFCMSDCDVAVKNRLKKAKGLSSKKENWPILLIFSNIGKFYSLTFFSAPLSIPNLASEINYF